MNLPLLRRVTIEFDERMHVMCTGIDRSAGAAVYWLHPPKPVTTEYEPLELDEMVSQAWRSIEKES